MDRTVLHTDLHTLLSATYDLLLPRVCVICGRELSLGEKHLCVNCMSDLPRTYFAPLLHNPMADEFNSLIAKEEYEPYCSAAALFYYSAHATSGNGGIETYGQIPQALKYRRNLDAGKYFGELLGRELAVSEAFSGIDAVVPVPLHWKRRWKRGYNQAEVLARAVADTMPGAVVDNSILKRTRATKSQAKSTVESRTANVSGAFTAKPGAKYRHILIVDDVFTTGNTLAQCHRALREVYGIDVRISVATLAYAGAL